VSCLGHKLIANGWPVLPLCWTDSAGQCACGRHHADKNAGKIPLTRHAVKDATTDAAQVGSWAAEWPDANWGVACSAVTVVDIDNRELASQLKEDAELVGGHFMVATPSRSGLHIYLLENNPTQQTRVLTSQDGQHLGEIRRAGSYVVGPGSKIAGRRYRPLTNNAPATVEDAEEWLADTLERFGVTLRQIRQQSVPQEWGPVDTEGVDPQAALDKALQALDPRQAEQLKAVLQGPQGWVQYSSRSEADWFAVLTLIQGGLSDAEVAAVWRHSALGQRDKVQRGNYVARTIANARAAIEVHKLGVGTSAVPTLVKQNTAADSVVVEARKAGQLAVEVDLLKAVNRMPRLADRLLELDEDGEPPDPGTVQNLLEELRKGPRLISAAPGVGKTYQVVQLAEESNMLLNHPILHLVPSHKSFGNVKRQPKWEHWQGHSDGEDGREPCPAYVRANKGYRPGRDCNCGWIASGDDPPGLPTVAPVEYVLADSPEGPPLRPAAMHFPLWVFDDVGLDKFVDTMVITRRDVELTAQHHPRNSAKALARALLRVLDSHTAEKQGKPMNQWPIWSGTAFCERLEEAFGAEGLSVDTWVGDTSKEILQPRQRGQDFWPDQPWIPEAGPGARRGLPINFMAKMFDNLMPDIESYWEGTRRNPHVHMVWDSPEREQPKQSIIRLRWRKYLPNGALLKTVVLDASADLGLWSTVLGAPVVEGETGHELLSPEGMPFPEAIRIVQMRNRHVGKSTLEHFDGDSSVAVQHLYRELLKREVRARKDLGQANKVGIITFQELIPDCVAALHEIGYVFSEITAQSEIVTGYYYNLRGANDFNGCDLLVLMGYPRPNPQGLYEEACALFQDDPEPISTEPAHYTDQIRLRNGHTVTIGKDLFGYKDPRLQALLLQKSRAELYQALHRARPFAPTTSVREILQFTDVPVPGVPVDTFFGRDGRMYDCLWQRLIEGAGEVTVPELVDGYLATGYEGAGAGREGLVKWVKRNADWLAAATGSKFVPGSNTRPGIFLPDTV